MVRMLADVEAPGEALLAPPGSAGGGSSASGGVDLLVLRDAVHYFKHACAVFGWPMHLWMNLTKPTRCSLNVLSPKIIRSVDGWIQGS